MPIIRTIMKGSSFLGKENQEAYKRLQDGEVLILEREPDNRYDPNAVRVKNIHGLKLAYVAKEDAPPVSAAMEAGIVPRCYVVEKSPRINIEWEDPISNEEEEHEGAFDSDELNEEEASFSRTWGQD